MPSKLVIVESPAKAKTIGKILGKDYVIMASYGHIRDLPERSFGVDIEHDFAPQYEESKSRGRNLGDLKKAAKGVAEVYLASDPDREGEAIAWHLHEVLKHANKKAEFHRVAFHEITKSAISRAFETPGDVNMDLVDAQQARRVLDRIVGYMISPLLWSKIERGVSAGRVQSVALRLVCEREREILAFQPKEYWNFSALFSQNADCTFQTKLAKIDRNKFEIGSKADADRILEAVRSAAAWTVASIEKQPRKRYAAPPFITSTLQQAASSALGFSASSTMRLAQQLYEGVDVGAGTVGLITYMRTDSVAVAVEAQNAARSFIADHFGKEFVPAKPNFYKSKTSAQGAHEAIRPTDISLTPEKLKSSLDPQQLKLYKLIWRRFMASQMSPAEQMRTTADIEGLGGDRVLYTFRATATVTTFPGFLKAYNIVEEGSAEEEETKDADALAALKEHGACRLEDLLSEQKFTEPPPRFSEATLIKELESNGIGRPSTYASIVNTIQERDYVNKEKGKLSPTELGFKINDYLVSSLPDLIQVGFTAEMENQLDKVEEGKLIWTKMLKAFYDQFSVWLSAAKSAGAPEAEKALALLQYLSNIQKWDAPEKGAKRIYDDKKFFNSVLSKSGKGVSAKQWDALMRLLVKYSEQLPAPEEFIAKQGLQEDYDTALARIAETEKIHAEFLARQEKAAEAAPPREDLLSLFQAMKDVKWNPPEKRRGRVYDDQKFFESLKKQMESGKVLSEKQLAALGKLASHYSGDIPDCDKLLSALGLSGNTAAASAAPSGDSGAQTDGVNAAAPGSGTEANAEVKSMLDELGRIQTWAEPVKKGRRVYDDHEFYDSLSKQFGSGKVLSFKQVAALKKMVQKYRK